METESYSDIYKKILANQNKYKDNGPNPFDPQSTDGMIFDLYNLQNKHIRDEKTKKQLEKMYIKLMLARQKEEQIKQMREDALTLPDLEDLSPPKGGKKKTRKYKRRVYNDSRRVVRAPMRSIRNHKQY